MPAHDDDLRRFEAKGAATSGRDRPAAGAWRAWLPAAAIAALALILRLWGIDTQSFWYDELFSVTHIHEGLGAILAAGFRYEPNPPLYYLLLRAWAGLFGDREFAARALSALLSAATVPVIYAAGAVIAGRRAGAIAALLFAAAVIQIEYGQEAREYALLVLGLSVALLGFSKALAERAAVPSRAAGTTFVVGIVVATYSHNTAVIYWFAMDLCLLLHVFVTAEHRKERRPATFLAAWVLWNAMAVALVAPQLYAMIKLRDGLGWIPPASPATVLRMVKGILFTYLAPDGGVSVLGLGVAGVGLVWAGLVNRKRPLILTLGVALPILAFATITFISIFRPIMLIRTVLFVPVPLYLLVGGALSQIAMVERRVIGVGFAVAFEILAMIVHWPLFAKEQWREIVPLIAQRSRPGDAVMLVSPEVRPAFDRYWPGGFPPARYQSLAGARPVWQAATVGEDRDWLTVAFAAVTNTVQHRGAVWLVARSDRAAALAALGTELSRSFVVQSRYWDNVNGTVLVTRIAPAPTR